MLCSRFIGEIPDDSVEKNHETMRESLDDFDFNQDESFEFREVSDP